MASKQTSCVGGVRPLFCLLGRVSHWLACALVALVFSSAVMARGSYMTMNEFVEAGFGASPPAPKTLWLSGDVQARLEAIFGHPYKALRVRYWQRGEKTAWMLEEIGKEMPITMGVLVSGNHIERVRILTYRESRGGEVRHDFFTEQFEGATLQDNDSLDRQIDGITGATLSVRAVTRVAQAALVLAETVSSDQVNTLAQ